MFVTSWGAEISSDAHSCRSVGHHCEFFLELGRLRRGLTTNLFPSPQSWGSTAITTRVSYWYRYPVSPCSLTRLASWSKTLSRTLWLLPKGHPTAVGVLRNPPSFISDPARAFFLVFISVAAGARIIDRLEESRLSSIRHLDEHERSAETLEELEVVGIEGGREDPEKTAAVTRHHLAVVLHAQVQWVPGFKEGLCMWQA